MAIELPQGLQINSKQAVDTRILLTKEKMLTADDNVMPVRYFAICVDDGRLYLYNKDNTVDETTGRFRLYEEIIDVPRAITKSLEKSPEALETAISGTLPGALSKALESQDLKDSGLAVDEDGNIKVNLNQEHLAIIDNQIELAVSLIQAIDGNT